MANRVEIERRGRRIVVTDNEETVAFRPEEMPTTAAGFIGEVARREECWSLIFFVQANKLPVYVNGELVPAEEVQRLLEGGRKE
jgi:hypothetical protein